jgi:hypothetical protein
MYLIGTQTRDVPACSTVTQPTTLPRAPIKGNVIVTSQNDKICKIKSKIILINANLDSIESPYSSFWTLLQLIVL